MKINRNGIEIELTKEEMIDAYYEQQHNFDVEYITGNLLEQYEDEHYLNVMLERLKNDKDFASKVGYRYRKYLEDSFGSETELECLKDAYNYICKTCDNKYYFEQVEICPECDGENVYPNWDIKEKGYIATCKYCGEKIFLCDACLHAKGYYDDCCDWYENDEGHGCYRGFIRKESKND